ncbi:MAG: hypothetical protein WAK27_02760, partial [Candidatus Sulfotelmatobacter sp.]
VIAKKNFVFGESGQRRGNGGLEGLRHLDTFRRRNRKLVILALLAAANTELTVWRRSSLSKSKSLAAVDDGPYFV